MPRRARVAPSGLVYHVLNRSVAGLPLFRKEADYEAFERIMVEAHQRCPTRILAWCLMRNHWHFVQRSLASSRPTVPTLPFVLECQSTSHLPAIPDVYRWGDEPLLLSRASQLKREESKKARRGILWSGWMEYLDPNGLFLDKADHLRCPDAEGISEHSSGRWKGYVGLIYADGNAMGQLVQELDSPEVCRAFSELVDGSIRDACYEALSEVCAPEIAESRSVLDRGGNPRRLPADILLLGGDDLLVLLPADRALNFALLVTEAFERLTREQPLAESLEPFLQWHGPLGAPNR